MPHPIHPTLSYIFVVLLLLISMQCLDWVGPLTRYLPTVQRGPCPCPWPCRQDWRRPSALPRRWGCPAAARQSPANRESLISTVSTDSILNTAPISSTNGRPSFLCRPSCKPVFRIHAQTFWCGSGSADPSLWLIDPDPAIFVIALQLFRLITFWRYIYIIFKDNKFKRSHKTVGINFFLTIFAWWQKDPGPYLWLEDLDPGGPKTCGTNGSGSGTLLQTDSPHFSENRFLDNTKIH
jgi:hypothetical protein